MSSLIYLGSLTVGECIPAAEDMQVQLLGDLQSRLAAQVGLVAQLNLNPGAFTIAGSLSTAQALVISIQEQITLGIELPSIQLQLAAASASIAALEAAVNLLLGLQTALNTAGIHAYVYEGPTNGLGAALSSALASGFPGGQPSEATNALVLGTTVPAAWAALGQLMKVTP